MNFKETMEAKAKELAERDAAKAVPVVTEADMDAMRPLIVDIDKLETEDPPINSINFLKSQYTLFNCPTLTIYIQGPKVGLPLLSELETNWRMYFCTDFLTIRTLGYAKTLTPRAKRLINEIKESPHLLYNAPEWHSTIIKGLVEEQVPVEISKVGSSPTVKATLVKYRRDLEHWLRRKGYQTIGEWEATRGYKGIDARIYDPRNMNLDLFS